MKLTVASCLFPISSDVRRNLEYVARQIQTARDRGADADGYAAHFPEACLSGYAGVDFASHADFDWPCSENANARKGYSTWRGIPASGSSSARRTG